MYLSRLNLDPRACQRELSDVRGMHGLVTSGFPTGMGRALWREDNGVLLIRSGDAPNWAVLRGRAEAEVKQVALPTEAGVYRFRLPYSPTTKVDGKRRCVRVDDRPFHLEYLLKKHGLKLLEARLPYGQELRGSGGERIVRVNAEGSLEVCDPEAFALALRCGIGAHRAYGCGLLDVIRA